MKYGKLENGRLCPAPKMIEKNGRVHYQPSESLLLESGFLPVVETPCPPSDGEMTSFACHFEERNGEIVTVWTEVGSDDGETEPA